MQASLRASAPHKVDAFVQFGQISGLIGAQCSQHEPASCTATQSYAHSFCWRPCVSVSNMQRSLHLCAGLLDQVVRASALHSVPLAGENALQRYDRYAFDRIAESAFGQVRLLGILVSSS